MGLLSLNLPVIGQSSATEDQKIRDGLAALQTGVNGNLDEANVPNLAAAFTTYKTMVVAAALPGSGTVTSAATFLMAPGVGGPSAVGAATTGAYAFGFDPADLLANARATKLRVRWQLITGAVAPGITITAGLYPVGSYSAASGVQMSVAVVGTVVAGSTAVFTTPALGTNTVTPSSEFNAPAAGDYVLGFATSGAMAAGAQATIRAQLQYRQV